MSSEIDESIKRLVGHKGVVGLIVINADGLPIKSTLENHQSIQYAGEIQLIIDKARQMIRELDSSNDLAFIRLRTKKHEVLIAPDREYAMIVIQTPSEV